MTDAAPLFKLMTKPLPRPHKFGSGRTVPAAESNSGHEQREWCCTRCGATRITVLPEGARMWRRAGEGVQLSDDFRPECVPAGGS